MRQEKKYSCGAFALKIILEFFGIIRKESYLRKLCKTTSEDGTMQNNLEETINYFGLSHKTITSKNKNVFHNKLKNNLPAIILTDNTEHWVAVTEYINKKYIIYDSMFPKTKQELSIKNLKKFGLNFDRKTKSSYFFAINIFKNEQ